MSLQVWLPLNGNLNNQGLADVSFAFNNATFIEGKIGKCLNLNNTKSNTVTIPALVNCSNYSIAFWYKPISATYSKWADVVTFPSKKDSDTGIVRFESSNTSGTSFNWYNPVGSDSGIGKNIKTTADTWYHVALTYDGSKYVTYLNGQLYYQNNVAGEQLQGTMSFGDSDMYGGLNDVRVYDHVLSLKEVKEISKSLCLHWRLNGNNNSNPNLAKGTNTSSTSTNSIGLSEQTGGSTRSIVYDNDNIPCLKIVRNTTEHSGWSYLWYNNWQRDIIKTSTTYTVSFYIKATVDGTIGFTGLLNGNATNYMTSSTKVISDKVKANEWSYICFQCTTLSSFDSITLGQQVIYFSVSSALLGTSAEMMFKNFKLEEGSVATPWCPNVSDSLWSAFGYDTSVEYDLSGVGHDGIRNGGFDIYNDSPRGYNSLTFTNSAAQYIGRPHLNQLNNFTFSCWARQTCVTTSSSGNTAHPYEFIISQGRDYKDASALSYGASIYTNRGIVVSYVGGGYLNSGYTMPLNEWVHLALTYDGTNARLYCNGELKAITAVSASTLLWDNNSEYFTVGKMAYAYGNSESYFPFVGQISDARVYATALLTDDIKELYNVPISIDNHGNLFCGEVIER